MPSTRTLGGSSAAPKLTDTPSIGTQRVALSSRGRTFIAVGVISLITGMFLGVLDLQRLGVLLIVLPIPAWLAVRQARSGLRIGHAVTPSRIVVGEQAQVRLVLGNPHSFGTGPLRITETVPGGRPLRFSVAGVRGRQRRTVAYPLPALRRGRYTVGPTTVMASDPFGLVTADTRSTDVGELIVRPSTVRLASLTLPVAWRDGAATLSHSVGSGGSDDASVREYRHGDDLRKIHWRSTARSGAFMVRQEERPWQGESLVLLDHRALAYPTAPAQPDSAALEWAISAAASIGCHLAERGRRVAVVTGDGDVAHDTPGAILDMLAGVTPALRADVEPLAAALAGLGRDAAVFAVIAATPKSSVSGLLHRPQTPGSAVAVLLRPWTWDAPGHDLLAEAAWQSSADMLRAAGWRVVPAEAGDDIADLWPSLLSARVPSVAR
ncbi:MAG TPA: DUF58 domain-containing protein [Jatrophihabitans sp.]|uniref:DUF58 domain-containing protein n=1 Tax=Jatrophihabitans sp. TaxID=1932789 RepID=UPI002F15638F